MDDPIDDNFTQPCLVVFAAQSIQTYILRSDKLREIVGASELVDSMARDLLDETLHQLGIPTSDIRVLSRAAGGARILFSNEPDARQFALVWPLLVARHAPGLPVSLIIVPVTGHPVTAIKEAEVRLRHRRAWPMAELPEAGPFTARHERSGRPVADGWKAFQADLTAPQARPFCDPETGRKEASAAQGHGRLRARLIADPDQASQTWPLDVNEIAGSEGGGLAIFHADGNGLGQVVMRLLDTLAAQQPDDALNTYQQFCEKVDGVTLAALKTALAEILQRLPPAETGKKYAGPFRPLVCAGDDVTVILRDCDAMDFARTFLEAIESGMRDGSLPAEYGLGQFTACGALVFTRPKFPFADAYTLAESMCGAAKKAVDRKVTALSFVRVASSLPGGYSDLVERERTLRDARGWEHRLTMNPYVLGKETAGTAHPRLDDLIALERQLWRVPRGSLRETIAAAYESLSAANDAYERFLQVLASRDGGKGNHQTFVSCLRKLTGNGLWTQDRQTPLYDALELKAVSRAPVTEGEKP